MYEFIININALFSYVELDIDRRSSAGGDSEVGEDGLIN